MYPTYSMSLPFASASASPPRLKTSPSCMQLPQFLSFQNQQYPFPNHLGLSPQMLARTVVEGLDQHAVDEIVRISDLNGIIPVKKIMRNRGKDAHTFSFYYQLVPFSLHKLLTTPSMHPMLHQHLLFVDFRGFFSETLPYLRLPYIPRLQDIGVTQNGELKMFVPPILMQPCNTSDQSKAVEKLVAWWQMTVGIASRAINNKFHNNTTQTSTLSKSYLYPHYEIQKIYHQSPSNQTSHRSKLAAYQHLQNESVQINDQPKSSNSSVLQHQSSQILLSAPRSINPTMMLKKSTNSYTGSISGMSSLQADRIKRIDEQIKFIRQKMLEKKEKREKQKIHKQPQNLMHPVSNQVKAADFKGVDRNQYENYQSLNSKMASSKRMMSNSNSNSPAQKKSLTPEPEKKTEQTSFFPPNQNINCINIYHQLLMTPPSLSQSNSLDTYEMDIDSQYDPLHSPKVRTNSEYRHTLLPREKGERSERGRKSEERGQNKKNGFTTNQVSKKNVHQSAGPLLFKNFVANYIKPQFLAKKSNIYQDPGEYESQKSASISKRKKEQLQNQRDPNQRQLLLRQPFPEQLSHNSRSVTPSHHSSFRQHANTMKAQKILQQTQRGIIQNEHIKRIQSSEQIGFLPKLSMGLEQKVKNAVLKTRQAILILKKSKDREISKDSKDNFRGHMN